eukprot:CAMPEP_0185040794 /NCGR_PEP_ID=MMETSP1103-20130426/39285_1 /TAXON_ID=36769 /ORGANISM="Paraphysomonas bandaiensis, Strain Caron Lab Isolate" /LENGTH=538 /DNA_ID=CAMNT_0027580233 /DNA_START=50 /DNA_END=1662 /DNA_ORIENTATION=+
MNFLDDLVGGSGCNVDGTASRNPVMSMANRLYDTMLPYDGVDGPDGSLERGVLESEVQHHSASVPSASHGMWNAHSQSMLGMGGSQVDLESIWMQQSGGMSAPMPQMMMMEMQRGMHMAHMQNAFMAEQHRRELDRHHQEQQMNETAFKGEESYIIDNEVEYEAESIDREAEMQRMVEEAWNASPVEGSTEEVEAFWQGVGQRGGWAGEENKTAWDAMWRAAHDRAMADAWVDRNTEGEIYSNTWLQETEGIAEGTENMIFTTPAEENPYSNSSESQSAEDLFERGLELYKQGQVGEAVLAFEASVSRDSENSEAWRMLGTCHADNDEDKRAIACLRRAVEADPFNLPALLSLGTSHVNELNSSEALSCLREWVKHNPKFHGLEVTPDEYSDGTLMDEVTQLMLAVSEFDPEDMEVQVVLGVLYNVRQDFAAAEAAFRRVADRNPSDYSIWNKIGATLANSSRCEEAIECYDRALELRPSYARAWLNRGIAFANSGRYDEAVKAYVQALALSPSAKHIWGYVRSVFSYQDKHNLVMIS